MQILSKSISIILFIIIILVIAFFLYSRIQSKKYPEKVPTIFGKSPLTILTNSMIPFIKAGDLVFIRKVSPSEVKVNDDITFKETETKFITHRVIEIKQDQGTVGFVTKGDNNNVKDSNIVTSNHLM
ncbi:signal peptidase I [Cytobacillus pseudoceanisediminis]|uniref:signal peptidase I n=1 Tax=Cytobacillus pseudoceanisediminis TaxID=3051614 RepID=UPI003C2D7118